MSAVIQQPDYHLRPMAQEDLAAVFAIEKEVYAFPWTEQIFVDCIRVGYYCRVVEKDNVVVGYAIMSTGAGEAHLLNLCVGKSWQRHGVGELLLRHMIEIAKNDQIEAIFLEVRPSNTAAMRLYDKAGFNQVGMRKDYYPSKGGREDACILALHFVG
ncbi:ribosomal protein S18-alanine N-acetyltransferase [Kaarinaea lacus]